LVELVVRKLKVVWLNSCAFLEKLMGLICHLTSHVNHLIYISVFLEAEEAMKMRLSPVARAGASAVMTAAGQDRGRARQS
jgi:hypothetical protein